MKNKLDRIAECIKHAVGQRACKGLFSVSYTAPTIFDSDRITPRCERAVSIALSRVAALAVLLLGGPAHATQLLPVEPGESSRFTAVGRIHAGGGTYCTGVLIRENIALTSAHCLFNQRTGRWLRPQSIHFLLGYDRGSYGFHSTVEEYRTGGATRRGSLPRKAEDDWALLRLQKKAPETFVPLAVSDETAGPFEVVGFANPRKYALSRSTNCVARLSRRVLFGKCPSTAGMSGAPLIHLRTGRLIGIQIGTTKAGEVLVGIPSSTWAAELDSLH